MRFPSVCSMLAANKRTADVIKNTNSGEMPLDGLRLIHRVIQNGMFHVKQRPCRTTLSERLPGAKGIGVYDAFFQAWWEHCFWLRLRQVPDGTCTKTIASKRIRAAF